MSQHEQICKHDQNEQNELAIVNMIKMSQHVST
jgi:hypothetical protein